MQKWLVSHWKLPCLQWFLGWKLLQWQQLQSSKLAWLFWPFEPNLELEQSNLFMGVDNFSGLARSVVRGEYIVENLKLCHDHHKNCPKGKHFFIYHIVASRSTCYYSENQKIRKSENQIFCILKSRIVTCQFFLRKNFFVCH